MKITVLIPTINEPAIDDVVKQTYEALSGFDTQVIVIDKSTDDTPTRAKNVGAHVITQYSTGYGDAYLQGFEHVGDSDIVIMIDGDNTYDPHEIPKLLEPLKSKRVDMVIGSRIENMEPSAMRFRNRLGNRIISYILNKMYHLNIKDTQSGFRAIKAEKLKLLVFTSGGMPFASEMIIEAAKNSLNIVEVPIRYRVRIGEVKLRAYRDGSQIIALMLRLVRDYNPLAIFVPPGIALITVGAAIGLNIAFQWVQTGIIERLASTILSALLIMAGMQVLFFGLLADIIIVSIRNHRHR